MLDLPAHVTLSTLAAAVAVALGACGGDEDPGVALADAVQVSVGDGHACALLRDGRVACWGANYYGQVGRPEDDLVWTRAVLAPELAGVSAVAADVSASCAIVGDGNVVCWGGNYSGELGVPGPTLPQTWHPTPVGGLGRAVALLASQPAQYGHDPGGFCARIVDGSVSCWGRLSPLTPTSLYGPVAPLPGVSDATGVAVRLGAGCELRTDRTVACWGYGTSNGQVGTNGYPVSSDVPQPVPGLSGVKAIAGGSFTFCALTADDGVTCWSQDFTPGMRPPAGATGPLRPIAGATDVVAIAAGGYDFYAVTRAGRVLKWSSEVPGMERPTPVSGVDDATTVAASYAFACAVTRLGNVKCWGKGDQGQLGDGRNDPGAYVKTEKATTVRLATEPQRDGSIVSRVPSQLDAATSD